LLALAFLAIGPRPGAAQQPAPQAALPAFDARDFANYVRSGPYEIQSTFAISLPGDETRSKAGIVVAAYPDRPYTRAWLRSSAQEIAERAHGPHEFDDPAPPAPLARYRHVATTDADGAFVIRGLTAGSYVIRGRLSVAFPRQVSVLHAVREGDANGIPIDSQQVEDETLVDYSYIWLEATSIGVGKHFEPEVYLHVVARRNKSAKPV
jgi:hypothetical protein